MMRVKLVALLALVAACSSGDGTAATAESTVPVETFALTYRYSPGDHHEYDFALDQRIQMTVEGTGPLADETPGGLDVSTQVAGSVAYDIGDGAGPDTVGLSISGLFDRVTTFGTIDGEEITEDSAGNVPDLLREPALTIVLDERGNVVTVAGEQTPDGFAFVGDPFSGLGDLTSGGLSNHFGPAFPDRELRAGDTWTLDRIEGIEGLTDEITVTTSYRLRGTETLAGREYVAIDFSSRTSEITIDLTEMIRSLFEAFATGADSGGQSPEIPEVSFVITVAPSEATGTIWFDESAGVTQRIEQATAATIDMVMETSDAEGSGRTDVHLEVRMDLVAELAGEDGS